jgi:hypothetical protein
MTVEEVIAKIKTLTAKEIIMLMVTSLRKKHTEINMHSYGNITNGICYGCAATNCLIELTEGEKDWLFPDKIRLTYKTEIELRKPENKNIEFIRSFERSIDSLRKGKLGFYHIYSKDINLPEIKNPIKLPLPFLDDNYTEKELAIYEKLADLQE